MNSVELRNLFQDIPQIMPFFRGVFAIDEIEELHLKIDEFVILNTE